MISIVTAYYNRKQLFINTLQSIKLQDSKYLLEVIAVDDGSDENERLEDLIPEFPFLKIIRLEKKNKWYHNSCIPFNIGFKAAQGDKIIIQNPECFHYGNILEYTEKNLEQNKYLSFGCFSLDKEATKNLSESPTMKYIAELIQKCNHIVEKDGEAGWYNHSIYRPEAYHFCTAITKKDLKKIDGFDELFALGVAYDDNEIIWRIRKKRMKIVFIDKEIVLHQNHYSPLSSSFENKKEKKSLLLRNKNIYNEITKKRGYRTNYILKFIPLSLKKHFSKYILFYLQYKIKLASKFNYLKEFKTTK